MKKPKIWLALGSVVLVWGLLELGVPPRTLWGASLALLGLTLLAVFAQSENLVGKGGAW